MAPIVSLVLVLAAWEGGLIHGLFNLREYTLAYPSRILDAMVEQSGGMSRQAVVTLTEASVGYVLGSLIGFVLAVTFVWFAPLRRVVLPIVNGLVAMPVIAMAPLMVLYFGSDKPSKIAVVTIMTLSPMAVGAFKGLISLDTSALELMRSYAASELHVFRKLRLPSALPFMFTALKLNVTLALIGAIVAEFFSSLGGLGFMMNRAIVAYNMPLAWAVMAIAGVAGVVLFIAVSLVERFAIPWHASVRHA